MVAVGLNSFSVEKRREIFEELLQGRAPKTGEYDDMVFRDATANGKPQMGSMRYAPDAIFFEYIYPSSTGAPAIFTVKVFAPDRIVFLPVPEWVIEQIWQGEITGSYHFEQDAQAMMQKFAASLLPAANSELFKD
jgi:hypothetical protein